MDDMNIFIPITKVDAARRLVYGVVTAEAPDIAGEVCDYASTKPLYQKWSQKFADATDGKSFGNLRAMHSNIAAGKLVDIAYDDAHKRIEICGKVVDDAEWACRGWWASLATVGSQQRCPFLERRDRTKPAG